MNYWSKIDHAAGKFSDKQTQTAQAPSIRRRLGLSSSRVRAIGARAGVGVSQFLACGVGDEIYALDVIHVREVVDIGPFHRLPKMPNFMRGLLNVRGKAIPVIELRVKFGLPSVETTERSRVVLLDVVVGGRSAIVGILSDQVFEVIPLEPAAFLPPPDIGVAWRSEMIRGLGRWQNRFVIVLNLNKLFSTEDGAFVSRARIRRRPA